MGRAIVERMIESESVPGVQYEIRRSRGGQLYCMCPGWRLKKTIVKNGVEFKAPCKHLRSLGQHQLHRMEVPARFFVRRTPV